MPPGLHMGFTMITCVHEIVSSLIVNFIQHCQGWVFSPPQWREFLMLVPSHGEEGITAVHQVTGNHGVRVNDWREWLWGISLTVKSDHKEHLKRYGKYISFNIYKKDMQIFLPWIFIYPTTYLINPYLLMLLHCGIYFLGEIIATMRHIGFLWILPLAALAFAGLFISITLSLFLSNSL